MKTEKIYENGVQAIFEVKQCETSFQIVPKKDEAVDLSRDLKS